MNPKNDDLMFSVPYVVYEQEQYKTRRIQTWLFTLCIILIVALIGTNLAWLIYEKQFETVQETTEETYMYDLEQESESGDNNFIGRDGDIYNGTTKDKGNSQEEND